MANRDDNPNARFGERIRHLRLLRGLSSDQLAQRIGVTFQTLNKYETGMTSVNIPRLLVLCDALEVVPSDLFENWPQAVRGNVLSAPNRLRELRKNSGKSLSTLAKAAGITRQSLSMLERNFRSMTVRSLLNLAEGLNCHPWAIVDPHMIVLTADEERMILRLRKDGGELQRR